MRTLLLAPLVLVPLLGGCAAAVIGIGAGVIATQELGDNGVYISQINKDARQVWPVVKTFLADASLELIEADDQVRVAKAKIDGYLVTVAVETYDVDRCTMRVAARRFGVNDADMAELLMERIHRRLK